MWASDIHGAWAAVGGSFKRELRAPLNMLGIDIDVDMGIESDRAVSINWGALFRKSRIGQGDEQHALFSYAPYTFYTGLCNKSLQT